jgi:cell division protein FtsI (penicillin-binding protein 3)
LGEGERWRRLGESQFVERIELPRIRGEIFDRKGRPLALNLPGITVYQIKDRVHDPDGTLNRLGIQARTSLSGKQAILLAQGLPLCHLSPLKRIDGLHLRRGWIRSYPCGEATGPLLGFVGRDGVGLEGIEYSFEDMLKGEPGHWRLIRTCDGEMLCCPELQDEPGRLGTDLNLTIDLDLQSMCYEALARQITEMDAKCGFVLVMNPKNGEILALVNYPGFDPEAPSWDQECMRNRALTDPYEPGSTLKLIVYSAAYGRGLIAPDDSVDTGDGVIEVQTKKIHDVHPLGKITYRDALVHSSNVAAAELALRMGAKNLYETAREFGIGSSSEIPLKGEGYGKLKHFSEWRDVYTATFSIGYSVLVNPFQLASIYGSVANGGTLLSPKLLKPAEDERTRELQVVRHVLDLQTADLLSNILESVVNEGTGVSARIPGVRVAGKTGTALKVNPETKQYDSRLVRASFIGYFPVENPEYLIYVVIDEPDVERGRYGSTVAAPLFKSIAMNAL